LTGVALVTVQTYDVMSDAEIARIRLSADGIRSVVSADNEGGLNPGFYRSYGVRLEVDAADLDDALDSLGIERIEVPRPVARAIAIHAEASAPSEGCGLLLVDAADEIVFACCLTNTDSSPHRFTIDPGEHFGAIRFAERNGWRVGGVFHSHLRSAPYPSAADLGGGGDPEWIHVIIGPVYGRNPELRAFRYTDGRVVEASVTVPS
jgi:proteasome lid subunit RPN8/RPN11